MVFFLIILGFVAVVVYFYMQGYRLAFSIEQRNYQTYQHSGAPKFAFEYDANQFEIDTDAENRFGDDYLVGVKLPSDARVGCDVRAVKGTLKLSDDEQKDGSRVAQQISQGADFFQAQNHRYEQIGGEKALRMDITVGGPLGELLRMDQAFLEHDGRTFNLICGTTAGTYPYFVNDFKRFFESLSFLPS